MNPGAPSRDALLLQAVNGDMTRIITNHPPRPLVIARRFEIARRVLAWLTGLGFGAAAVKAFLAPGEGTVTVMAAAVMAGLIYTFVWGLTIKFAHEARVELFRKYGVAPNRDGVFELLRPTEPHEDLAATREMLRVYANEPA